MTKFEYIDHQAHSSLEVEREPDGTVDFYVVYQTYDGCVSNTISLPEPIVKALAEFLKGDGG